MGIGYSRNEAGRMELLVLTFLRVDMEEYVVFFYVPIGNVSENSLTIMVRRDSYTVGYLHQMGRHLVITYR